MSLTSEQAALKVLALIKSPLLQHDQFDAYEALAAADRKMGSLSTGEGILLAEAWAIFNGSHRLASLDADNAAAVLRILAERYAPQARVVQS